MRIIQYRMLYVFQFVLAPLPYGTSRRGTFIHIPGIYIDRERENDKRRFDTPIIEIAIIPSIFKEDPIVGDDLRTSSQLALCYQKIPTIPAQLYTQDCTQAASDYRLERPPVRYIPRYSSLYILPHVVLRPPRPKTGTMRFGPMAGLVGRAFDLIL